MGLVSTTNKHDTPGFKDICRRAPWWPLLTQHKYREVCRFQVALACGGQADKAVLLIVGISGAGCRYVLAMPSAVRACRFGLPYGTLLAFVFIFSVQSFNCFTKITTQHVSVLGVGRRMTVGAKRLPTR